MKSFKQSPQEMNEFLNFLEEDLENIKNVRNEMENFNVEYSFEIHAKAETVNESAKHSSIEKNQIVKTLVFFAGQDPVAVLCPGNKRVSEDKIQDLTGRTVRMASPEEVYEKTGYPVGAVSPFNLEITVYMHKELLEYEEVRPAAGSRLVGINIGPEDLKEVSNAETHDLVE